MPRYYIKFTKRGKKHELTKKALWIYEVGGTRDGNIHDIHLFGSSDHSTENKMIVVTNSNTKPDKSEKSEIDLNRNL